MNHANPPGYSPALNCPSYSSRAECRSQSAAAEFVSRLSEGREGAGAAHGFGLPLRPGAILAISAEAEARLERGAASGRARLPQLASLQRSGWAQRGAEAVGAAALLQVPAAGPLHRQRSHVEH